MSTLEEVFSAYRNSHQWKKLAPATRLNTEKSLRRLAPYMTQDIKRLTRTRLLAILDEAPAGAAYVFGTRMRALFQFEVERGYLSENPMAGVSIPKTEGEHRPWTAAELSAFMADDVDEQLRMGILLAYYTAQREGDVLKMRWTDIIEGEAIFVVQEKTGIRLFAPIHPELKAALDKHHMRYFDIQAQALGTLPRSAITGKVIRLVDKRVL